MLMVLSSQPLSCLVAVVSFDSLLYFVVIHSCAAALPSLVMSSSKPFFGAHSGRLAQHLVTHNTQALSHTLYNKVIVRLSH